MTTKSFIVSFFLVVGAYCQGQRPINGRNDFYPPLSIPLSISGNYGDVRAASFHFGIDYSTNGERGLPVFVIDSGYVSRIKVEAGGYGKVLYITHPYGVTSVYAHLDSFSLAIACFVREKQYQSQSFAQDIQLDSNLFRVKKGELIGYSGNSGQSTGPHLHFELRKTANQNTIQPFIFAFHSRDTIPPVLEKVLLYPELHYLSKEPLPAITIAVGKGKSTVNATTNDTYIRTYLSVDSTVWQVPTRFFVGLSAFDQLVRDGRMLSFYASRIWLDTTLVFEFLMDELSFTEVGWVNGLIDYQRKILQKENVYLQFLYPNFTVTPVKKAQNNGLISLMDTLVHQLTVEVKDFSGNKALFSFKVKRSTANDGVNNPAGKAANTLIPAGKLKIVHKRGVNIVFSPSSLYANSEIAIRRVRRASLYTGYLIEVGHEAIPLKSPVTLEFVISIIPHRYWSKLRVVRLKGNSMESIGGDLEGQILKARTKILGNFSLALDTIPPTLQFLNLKENARASNNIRVRVTDNLAGIKSWAGYIDGQWVLFEYDRKSGELCYTFDEKCVATGGVHSLEIQVEDFCGNKRVKIRRFIY